MIDFPKLNFPKDFQFQIKKERSKVYIFDEIRQKFLVLTPEEFVRQHIIRYFKDSMNLSKSAFILEKKIEVNKTTKRIDVMIVNKNSVEYLIECKAPHIEITEKTFEQIARYNSTIQAKKILLTNGMIHFLMEYHHDDNSYTLISNTLD
jgi:hypothetical protein